MIKSITKIEKLYYSICPERIKEKEMEYNNFLMCGNLNWEYYFTKNTINRYKYRICSRDVSLLEFDNKKDLYSYMSLRNIKRDSKEFINMCIEDNYNALLIKNFKSI